MIFTSGGFVEGPRRDFFFVAVLLMLEGDAKEVAS